MKKAIQIIFILMIILSLLNCKTEKQKDQEIITEVVAKRYNNARSLVREYYENDQQKGLSWMLAIQEQENKDYLDHVQIEDGWKWTFEDDYSYIRGNIKNIGDKSIDYFKISAHYKDSERNVIDTDYTNSGETLGPGMSKEFEIMHRRSSNYKYTTVFVEEISVK